MHWHPIGEMARQHRADLEREGTQHALARLAHVERGESTIRSLVAGIPARLGSTILAVVRRDHAMTDHPCRLPDGSIGRVAVIHLEGDWVLVCRAA